MITNDLRLAVGIALLVGAAAAVLTWFGVRQRRAVATATLRAAAQLTALAAVLRGVFAAPFAAIAVITTMFAVAVWTSGRRNRAHPHAIRATTYGAVRGRSSPSASSSQSRWSNATPARGRGGRHRDRRRCMTAATLTGRHLSQALVQRRDEVEAWLALGATNRAAVLELARSAVYNALVPALDQTRTVGLVTLPGTFVGALVGGASAAGAARFQLTVLVALAVRGSSHRGHAGLGARCARHLAGSVLAIRRQSGITTIIVVVVTAIREVRRWPH